MAPQSVPLTVGDRRRAAAGAAAASVGAGASAANASREERVPVKGVKKAMANAMVTSAFTSPHVTIGVEVDVTGMMDPGAPAQGRPRTGR